MGIKYSQMTFAIPTIAFFLFLPSHPHISLLSQFPLYLLLPMLWMFGLTGHFYGGHLLPTCIITAVVKPRTHTCFPTMYVGLARKSGSLGAGPSSDNVWIWSSVSVRLEKPVRKWCSTKGKPKGRRKKDIKFYTMKLKFSHYFSFIFPSTRYM